MIGGPPAIDARALIAAIRARDPDAMAQAYAVTFGNELGRLVLAHHLAECGVGNLLGKDDLAYKAGRHDAAVTLAAAAGFDQAALAAAVLTDTLETEGTHDRDDHDTKPRYDDDGDGIDLI